jgi:stearoyl-CoA desaturase (delta-9 desaturase)
VPFVGISATAVAVAVGLYALRMFAITAFYHRYFSHRAFRTSRAFQFAMALVGCMAAQRGPLWWAAHHRHHHARSDEPEDVHSPRQRGFWHSHAGWFMTREAFGTRQRYVRDWLRFPELRFLNRFDWLGPLLLLGMLLGAGALLASWAPGLGTDALQLAVWGFGVSTVVPATASSWRCSRSARDGTTTTTTSPRPRVRASAGGSWTSRSTCCGSSPGSASSAT